MVTREKYAEAKRLWKIAKIVGNDPKKQEAWGLKPPLTEEQVEILKGTAYYHHFKRVGWIENPPY